MRRALPAPGGGLTAQTLQAATDTYGIEAAYLVGGGLHRAGVAGRAQANLESNAEEFRRLIESASSEDQVIRPFEGDTAIFITPGYRFRGIDGLMTNFHLPRSTLFMLVSAFDGLERMKAAYAHAVRERYRFYSYGDCCLLRR